MASKKQSLDKLRDIFEEHTSYRTDMMFRNMFASACYLSIHGESIAAKKMLRSLFDWLGYNNRKTYFSNIMSSLDEFASDYAFEIGANLEINKIFNHESNA